MSRHLVAPRPVTRRQFLALPLALVRPPVGWLGRGWAATTSEARKGTYTADVGILYGLLTFHLDGVLAEAIDRAGGRYDVSITGEGDGIANRIESRGLLQDGRWAPLEGDAYAGSGKPTALFDLTHFSSWAKKGEPARVTFGTDRRPELLLMSLILGSSAKIELRAP